MDWLAAASPVSVWGCVTMLSGGREFMALCSRTLWAALLVILLGRFLVVRSFYSVSAQTRQQTTDLTTAAMNPASDNGIQPLLAKSLSWNQIELRWATPILPILSASIRAVQDAKERKINDCPYD